MSQPARKSGDGGKFADSLPADDPSIPVLTERLTLPPLDLDLDFRLPPRPGQPTERAPEAPEARPVTLDDEQTRFAPLDETRYSPLEDEATRLSLEARRVFEPTQFDPARGPDSRITIAPEAPTPTEGPVTHGSFGNPDVDTRGGPSTRSGADAHLGADTRTGVDSRFGAGTRSGVDTRFDAPVREDARNGPDTFAVEPALGQETRGGPETRGSPEARGGADAPGNEPLAGPLTRGGPPTVGPAAEPEEAAPRVPTSLLVSNTLLSTPTHRRPQQDDFDLTVTDDGRGINQLDTELRERILLDLARRLPTEVDTIVRRHLETAIEEAVRRFGAEVRIALAGSLREIVDRAVKAELERVKNARK